MTKKVYRTAQGKVVDLGALILKNENVRAVGNMNVNARGDVLDSLNNPVVTRNQQVSKQYAKQTTNVGNHRVGSNSRRNTMEQAAPDVVDEPQVIDEPAPVEEDQSSGGLAAAIAKARSIKQEPLKTPRQLAQSRPGVNKI